MQGRAHPPENKSEELAKNRLSNAAVVYLGTAFVACYLSQERKKENRSTNKPRNSAVKHTIDIGGPDSARKPKT